MTITDEFLLATERLAEAAEEVREAVNRSPPRRAEYDDGALGEQEFQFALEFYMEDQEAARVSLARALRNYRRLQEHELNARAIAHTGEARAPI